jgi:hypothetical protein
MEVDAEERVRNQRIKEELKFMADQNRRRQMTSTTVSKVLGIGATLPTPTHIPPNKSVKFEMDIAKKLNREMTQLRLDTAAAAYDDHSLCANSVSDGAGPGQGLTLGAYPGYSKNRRGGPYEQDEDGDDEYDIIGPSCNSGGHSMPILRPSDVQQQYQQEQRQPQHQHQHQRQQQQQPNHYQQPQPHQLPHQQLQHSPNKAAMGFTAADFISGGQKQTDRSYAAAAAAGAVVGITDMTYNSPPSSPFSVPRLKASKPEVIRLNTTGAVKPNRKTVIQSKRTLKYLQMAACGSEVRQLSPTTICSYGREGRGGRGGNDWVGGNSIIITKTNSALSVSPGDAFYATNNNDVSSPFDYPSRLPSGRSLQSMSTITASSQIVIIDDYDSRKDRGRSRGTPIRITNNDRNNSSKYNNKSSQPAL